MCDGFGKVTMGMAKQHDLIFELQRVITDLLPDGYPLISATADRMGLSVRTLQRRLAELEISYAELVARLRFSRACLELRKPGVRIAELSARMGYRDPSSFSRAFVRWSGLSPQKYRQQCTTSTHQSLDSSISAPHDLSKTPVSG